MSASNLFDDIEGDDDIFSTPVAKTPKKKKGWMDDLLDDESELFKSANKDNVIKPEPVEEKGAGLSGKSSGGGLFDDFSLDEPEDKPSASVNGHKDDNEEFVVVSHDEVPTAEEAEKMAATVSPGEGQAADEADGQQQTDELFNQNLSYEERARIRREQRRKKAEDRARSQSNTPSPQPDTQEDPKRDQRSASPSPSPGIEDSSVESGKDAPSAPQPTDQTDMVTGGNDKKEDTPSPSPEPDEAPEQDAAEQVWLLTKSLQRAQAENAQLQSDNDSLNEENKSLRDRVAELEKQLNSKNKEVEDLTTAHQKQVSDLEQQLKQKTKEIEDMKSTKKVEHKHEPKDHHKREPRAPVTMVALKKTATHSPAGSPATKSKFRAGVDKGRPITSVADSVKKFSGATPATDVKKSHTVVTTKAKHSSPSHAKHEEKPPPAKKTVTTLPSKPPPSPKPSGRIAHHDKHEHHAHPAKPHPPHGHTDTHHHKAEHPSKTVRVTTHKKPHPHHHHHHHHAHTDKKGAEHHVKKMEGEKKTEEATVSKEEPKAEPEAVAPPTEQAPPTEPKEEVSGESEEKKVEEKPTQSVTDETTRRELEKDTTRAKRVISIFENKATTPQETPAWKVNAQQQREEKEKLEREKEAERQKEKEREESAEPEKSRTSSNASSSKDPEPVVNGNADAASAESAEKESESVDGAQLSKTRSQSSPLGTASKSTSSLPNTNKNDEVIPRDNNKMRKTTSSSNNIMADPKKRLMAEDVKGKRSSWAAPKREECAVCGKVVYVMERLEADKVVYHKTCFKCTVCNKTLSTGTYAALQGKTYCKVHFKQLFKMKGNYDEGFGREQHKTKWIKKDPLDGESEA